MIGICHENGFYWNILGTKNAFDIITKINTVNKYVGFQLVVSRLYIDKPFLGRSQITLIINGSKLELVVVWSISWIKEKPTHEKAHTPKVSTRQTQRFILKLVANVPTAVFWCLFIRVWKQSNGCIFFFKLWYLMFICEKVKFKIWSMKLI